MVDCYVIVTTRNILWMVLSVVATLAVITGIMTPKWLYGRSKIFDDQTYNSSVFVPPEAMYKPSVGIYNRCKKIQRVIGGDPVLNCYSYIEDFMEIPSDAWKACMVFLCFGVFLLGAAGIMSLVGFCVQSVGKKSIFSLGGLIQAIAGITRCNINSCFISVTYEPPPIQATWLWQSVTPDSPGICLYIRPLPTYFYFSMYLNNSCELVHVNGAIFTDWRLPFTAAKLLCPISLSIWHKAWMFCVSPVLFFKNCNAELIFLYLKNNKIFKSGVT